MQLTLTPTALHIRAGVRFQVLAKLEQPAPDNLVITFEKHRVWVDMSGGRYLCVIQDGYFTDDGFPKPIELRRGDTEGTTSAQVSAKAMNPPCPEVNPPDPSVPVEFPDRLMLTAFVKTQEAGTLIGKEHVVVTITSP
ncbi:MAG TPA: hypothetical protein VF251_13265 [Pyrinomonadaceae bacterium]